MSCTLIRITAEIHVYLCIQTVCDRCLMHLKYQCIAGSIKKGFFFCPTHEFFTHMETPLPMKNFKCWPVLGTHCHWAVRVLQRATPTVTGASVYNGHLRGPKTLTPVAERFAVELSLPDIKTYILILDNSLFKRRKYIPFKDLLNELK